MDDGYLQYYKNEVFHDLIPIYADTWYHISIDFRCNGGSAYKGLDENKFQIRVNGHNNGPYSLVGSGDICSIKLLSSFQEKDYYGYYDAFGFSWKNDYNEGDNQNEGILIEFEPDDISDMYYNLDSSTDITIYGDTVIPMPSVGEHTIEVGGENYDASTVDFTVSPIKIITPEINRVYANLETDTSGVFEYPGMYTFDNDDINDPPYDWDIELNGAGTCQVIGVKGTHANVVELKDTVSASGKNVKMTNTFLGQTTGSIECWVRASHNNRRVSLVLQEDEDNKIDLRFDTDGSLKYHDGSAYQTIMSYSANTWYHLRVEFHVPWDWHLWVDGVSQDNGAGYDFKSSTTEISSIQFKTATTEGVDYYMFVDAIGYSWDPYYTIGDNCFSMISSGQFPGTYSFEDDVDGNNPEEWDTTETGGTVNVISEEGDHKKVVQFTKTASGSLCEIHQTFTTAQTTGKIEFWMRTNNNFRKQSFSIFDGTTKIIQVILDGDGKLTYYDNGWKEGFIYSKDTWYWFSVHLDMTPTTNDLYDLTIIDEDGNLKHEGSDYTTIADSTQFDYVKFASAKYQQSWTWYVDAIGYSWDPTYFDGNNWEEGFLLEYTSDIQLSNVKYELDGNEKSIDGDIYLPIYQYKGYTLKITGYGPNSTYYESELINYRTMITENLDNHWALEECNVDDTWYGFSNKVKGQGIKVLVIDSGIDIDHPDLIANYKGGYDFFNDDENPNNDCNEDYGPHGTRCSGLIAATDNYYGSIGIAPEVQIYMARITNDHGEESGNYWATLSDAINWGIDNNMDVISMSKSWEPEMNTYLVREACEDAYEAGIILVASSGNEGESLNSYSQYPAEFNEVIAVGAVEKNLQIQESSNYGFNLSIVAPGAEIFTTSVQKTYVDDFGCTSAACPFVAGVCALILSASSSIYNTQGSSRVIKVRNCLFNSARELGTTGKDIYYGWGLVDAYDAVDYALDNY